MISSKDMSDGRYYTHERDAPKENKTQEKQEKENKKYVEYLHKFKSYRYNVECVVALPSNLI